MVEINQEEEAMLKFFTTIYLYFFLIQVEEKSPVEEEAEPPATDTPDLDEIPVDDDEEPVIEETSNIEVTPALTSDDISLKVNQGKFLFKCSSHSNPNWYNNNWLLKKKKTKWAFNEFIGFSCFPCVSDIDGLITQALLTGDYEAAVNLCLHDNRMADGIILAIAGGPELLEKTQKKYFTKTQSKISKVRSYITQGWALTQI